MSSKAKAPKLEEQKKPAEGPCGGCATCGKAKGGCGCALGGKSKKAKGGKAAGGAAGGAAAAGGAKGGKKKGKKGK
jgi:hypothetical protein